MTPEIQGIVESLIGQANAARDAAAARMGQLYAALAEKEAKIVEQTEEMAKLKEELKPYVATTAAAVDAAIEASVSLVREG